MIVCSLRPLGAGSPSFEEVIAPILESRCQKCHSGSAPAGDLNVGSLNSLVKGGKSGPAIVAGASARSNLLLRIENGQMPPGGPALQKSEIERIRTWIESGAGALDPSGSAEPGTRTRDRDHWAFQKPIRTAPPKVRDAARVRTAVDAFLLSTLEKRELNFSGTRTAAH